MTLLIHYPKHARRTLIRKRPVLRLIAGTAIAVVAALIFLAIGALIVGAVVIVQIAQ